MKIITKAIFILLLISCKTDSILDEDGDGVPNSIDLEINSREGVPVDENGVMLNPIYLDENEVTIKANTQSQKSQIHQRAFHFGIECISDK